MKIVAKSEEMISRSLTVLLWQSRFAGLAVGAFAAFFAAMIGGLRASLLPYAAVFGAVVGLLMAALHWKRSIGRLARSFLKVHGDHLEGQGIVNGGLAHFRFRLSDLATVELGRKGAFVVGSLPAIRAFDGAALVVREKSGDGIVLQLAGVVFDANDLSRFCEHVLLRGTK